MSGSEIGPGDPSTPTSRPRFWRRWLRRLLWVLGALAVLLALLHAPPAKRLVTRAVVHPRPAAPRHLARRPGHVRLQPGAPLSCGKQVYGGVFYDTGNVWPLASDLDLGDLRSNVGGGVRVMFPFGPLRLDWAWVLDPMEGEQRSRWQFALGHAF